LAELCTATLLSLDSSPSNGLGNSEEALEIERGVPAGIVFPVARHTRAAGPLSQCGNAFQGSQHLVLPAHDASQGLHHFLQVMLKLVRPLSGGDTVLERLERVACGMLCLAGVDLSRAFVGGEGRGIAAGALTENKEVRQRVPAQAVGAVKPGPTLACSK